LNIPDYWVLPLKEKDAIYREVIKPKEYCEECSAECSETGVTCWWCEAVVCPEHAFDEQWSGLDIKICKSCLSWKSQR